MTLNELQKNCVKKLPPNLTRGDEALYSLWGISSYAGGLLAMYKKTLYEGAELPQKEFVEGLCDIIRNVATAAHAVDVDLESVMKGVNEQTKAVNTREKDSDAGDN